MGDTTVVAKGQMLAKPTDIEDAKRMLRILAGNWHEVLTGIAVVRDGVTRSAIQGTQVKFSAMTGAEIDFLAELYWPGTVEIGTGVSRIGRSSFGLTQGVFNRGRLAAAILSGE